MRIRFGYAPLAFFVLIVGCASSGTDSVTSNQSASGGITAPDPVARPINGSPSVGLPEVDLVFHNPDGRKASFKVEVAYGIEQRMKGLMFRRSMAVDRGMLFVFPDDDVRSFYMKDTYIPLDMLFVDRDMIVRGVVENTSPLTLDSRGVDVPVRYVIEINAFLARQHGIVPGSAVSIKPDLDVALVQ